MRNRPWQQVDNDNNNTDEVVTEVSAFRDILEIMYALLIKRYFSA